MHGVITSQANQDYWRDAISSIYMTAGQRFSNITWQRIQREAGLMSAPQAKATPSEWQQAVMLYLSEKSGDLIQGITTTTLRRIQSVLADASIVDGELDVARLINDTNRDIRIGRARTIARTETNRAVQVTQQATQREAERTLGVQIQREWVSILDHRGRHHDADGQLRGLDERFSVAGEALDYPGDPSGSAENTINCRCTIIEHVTT